MTKRFAGLFILTLFVNNVIAQVTYSKIKIDKPFKDTLSFVNLWDYPVGIFKDDSTGEFTTAGDPLDTTHLFFTANCSTNVQGGYKIRYCFAEKHSNYILLKFSDGLPAYASEYYLHIRGDSFYFRPKTIYPIKYPGERISYHVTEQKLTLNKTNYNLGDTILGYVASEFIETVVVPKMGTQSHKFYLKGFIKTSLRPSVKNGR